MKNRLFIVLAILAMAGFIVSCSSDSSSVKKSGKGSGFLNKVSAMNTNSILGLADRSKETVKEKDTSDEEVKPKGKQQEKGVGGEIGDEHFIQPDDYFISDRAFTNQTYIYVHIAKVKTAPTAQTKNEGEFMQVRDGKEYWTKYYWMTRVATKADIKLGAVIICFEGASRDDVYQAPENKKEARREGWFMAKITDTSDLYKGFVTVSGGYKVSTDNLRVKK